MSPTKDDIEEARTDWRKFATKPRTKNRRRWESPVYWMRRRIKARRFIQRARHARAEA